MIYSSLFLALLILQLFFTIGDSRNSYSSILTTSPQIDDTHPPTHRQNSQEHLLYDLNLPDNKIINVSTIIRGVNRPIGIATGSYQNKKGVFMTSFVTSDIRFIETNSACEFTGTCQSILVAGTGFSGYKNGSLATATFSDPSRLVYVEEHNVLFITDRATGYIRYIDFNSNYVGTMTQSDGTKISILPNTRPDNQPGTDIKYSNNYLYLTDGINVYNLTGSQTQTDSQLTSSYSSAILTSYSTLRQWQIINDYDSSNRKIYITSIAINSNKQVMYVSYALSRNALVTVPLHCKSSTEISILYSDNILWDSDKLFSIGYPKPANGNLYTSPSVIGTGFALVTYPMHLHYNHKDDTLYWTEIYSHLSSGTSVGALGAVAIRRLNFLTNEIDYYAGDQGTFRPILGRATGFRDGACDKAQFSYPMTIAFVEETSGVATSLGPQIYVGDYGNNAIRKVATLVNTPTPTMTPTFSVRPTQQPTISLRPTLTPTRVPTLSPSQIPSALPSLEPSTSQPSTATPSSQPTGTPTGIPSSAPSLTMAPTRSMPPTSAPTELNGDCFEIILFDEFGDGWHGAILNITHRPPPPKPRSPPPPPPPGSSSSSSPPSSPAHPSPSRSFTFQSSLSSPQAHFICASLDEDRAYERGTYSIHFSSSSSPSSSPLSLTEVIPFHWEIGFQISTKKQNFQNVIYGTLHTQIDLEFGPSSDSEGQRDGEFSYRSIRSPAQLQQTCMQCPHPKPKPPAPPPDASSAASPASDGSGPGPRPSGIPLSLTASGENDWTWFPSSASSSLFPTRYVITDASKLNLLLTGQMCNPSPSSSISTATEMCEIRLEDGDYYFRVGGETSEEVDDNNGISWHFCGTQGISNEELSFSVINGHCYLGHQVSLATMLSSTEQTILSLEGDLLIENIFTEELSLSDQRIFEMSLAEALTLPSSDVSLLDICKTKPGVPCYTQRDHQPALTPPQKKGPRLLSDSSSSALGSGYDSHSPQRALSATYAYHLSFSVTILLNQEEAEGTQRKEIWRYVSELKEQFDLSCHQGTLQSLIRSHSSSSGISSGLGYIRLGKQSSSPTSSSPSSSSSWSSGSLYLTSVDYTYIPLTSSPSISPVDSAATAAESVVMVMDETTQQELLILTPFFFIFGALAIVMILAYRSKQLAPPAVASACNDKINQMEENSSPSPVSPDSDKKDEAHDIFVQRALQSIPDHKTSHRFLVPTSSNLSNDNGTSSNLPWESERRSLPANSNCHNETLSSSTSSYEEIL